MMKPKTKAVIKEWVESLVIALVLAMFIRTFIVQAFKIPSGSMRPTLMEGDKILVNKLLYGAKIPFTDKRLPKVRDPKRGDIVVFVYPENPKKDFIKRLMAEGGEKVRLNDGNIYIDGELVKEPHKIREIYYYNRGQYGRAGGEISVPEDFYFVLGDNSSSSRDSRYWGFVPEKDLIGRAMVIYWPPNRIGIIK